MAFVCSVAILFTQTGLADSATKQAPTISAVFGRVLDEFGNSFPTVGVTLDTGTQMQSTITAIDGEFGLVYLDTDILPTRILQFSLEIPDSTIPFEDASATVTVTPGEFIFVTLIGPRGSGNSVFGGTGALESTKQEGDGPIFFPGVRVTAFLENQFIAETETIENGSYSFADLTGREETVNLVFDKEGLETREAIVDLDDERTQVLGVEMAVAGQILASSIVCVVQDAETHEKILDATVSLDPAVSAPITGSEYGVYTFPVLNSGTYIVTATVPGLPAGSRTVTLSPGGLASLTISTGKHQDRIGEGVGVGEGEGEGEGEGGVEGEGEEPPGCSAGSTTSTSLWGDLAVMLAALVVLGAHGRRRTA